MWPFRRDSDTPWTVEAGLARFFDLKDEWLQSTCRDRLLGLLEQYKPAEGWNFSQAIVLGAGNFLSADKKLTGDAIESREKSLMQLVLFLDIVDNCKCPGPLSICCYGSD